MNALVSIHDGAAFANSRDVAAKFGKRHADVLRTIDQLIAQAPELNQRNFAFVGYVDEKGEHRPGYNLDRDGFALLAMGFTGKSALRWKLRYIEAFSR
ncbi:MAG TPA: Rha family transcriptional regulator [Pseudolabrys sp.]|nr:Rha family transcriptional regulator [Pseudolabrys sp.]